MRRKEEVNVYENGSIPLVNANREAFCQAILQGMTRHEALLASYNNGLNHRRVGGSKKQQVTRASALFNEPEVKARIEYLRSELDGERRLSRDAKLKMIEDRLGGETITTRDFCDLIKLHNAMCGDEAPKRQEIRFGFSTDALSRLESAMDKRVKPALGAEVVDSLPVPADAPADVPEGAPVADLAEGAKPEKPVNPAKPVKGKKVLKMSYMRRS